MRFKKGDKVEFIYRNKKSVGVINGVYPEKQAVEVIANGCLNVSFSDKAVVKVEEQERIVVPQFVADFLENHSKEDGHTLHDLLCDLLTSRDSLDENVYDWIMRNNNENGDLLARAWLDGYEVEKEPLYYVKLPYSIWNDAAAELELIHMYVLLNIQSDETTISGNYAWIDYLKNKDWRIELTEAEIKEMDERYWQFAVLVEEVEA
ncbi:TPA_asm: DUF1642 domain-containing protein [Listeria monocytogenes]|nr:DUF1642 domain-containing protein [Listeria monocytogenes]